MDGAASERLMFRSLRFQEVLKYGAKSRGAKVLFSQGGRALPLQNAPDAFKQQGVHFRVPSIPSTPRDSVVLARSF